MPPTFFTKITHYPYWPSIDTAPAVAQNISIISERFMSLFMSDGHISLLYRHVIRKQAGVNPKGFLLLRVV